MAKKHKCIECDCHIGWCTEIDIKDDESLNYAKRVVRLAERTIVCGQTMKTKMIDHEQYCKYYEHEDSNDYAQKIKAMNDRGLQKLKDEITEYEKRVDK